MSNAPLQQPQLITVDDLMALGSDVRVEVIEGEIVEMSPVGGTHQFIAGNVFRLLDAFVRQHQLGYVMPDGLLYLLDVDTKHLRGALVPDVSFIRKSSIPADWNMDLPFPGAPDLTVEVVSPNDDADKLMARVRRFLEFGTDEVWVLYPKSKTLSRTLISQPKIIQAYHEEDTLKPDALFPGLEIAVNDLFVLPDFNASD
jgi:Uma2 family endonuclease